ncbi:hypothetical protein LEP1GSC195_0322 [Leptospira wolbachii serovar Codice str. CDC]|uniref:Uncharacterized protein n=1 Tax=Leptospira wolbachii serovar Codice str. CDC TaxID=1218599 RepID=R9A3B2_9LEPT|nr:hypothetical protein LEP1GSC195_0322 [Leptospira wolbachii serovar Codice str. CDC]
MRRKKIPRKGSKRKSFLEGKDCSGEPGRFGFNLEIGMDSMRPKFSVVFYFGL